MPSQRLNTYHFVIPLYLLIKIKAMFILPIYGGYMTQEITLTCYLPPAAPGLITNLKGARARPPGADLSLPANHAAANPPAPNNNATPDSVCCK